MELLTCSICGNRHDKTTDVVVEQQHLCNVCANEYTDTCHHCGDRYFNHNLTRGFCESCHNELFTACTNCGCDIRLDSANYLNDGDAPYCDSCYDSICQVIHDYSYKPKPIFHGSNERYLGVELEIDEGGIDEDSADDLLFIANKYSENLYIKRDGSITHGFELVSHPMTLSYHTDNMPWQEIFKKAIQLGYRSHQPGTCGLHVHISRDMLGDSYDERECTIAKILYFYEKFWNEILKFSRRNESQINRWARRYGGGLINPSESLRRAKTSDLGRYVAVNLQNEHTIEMRVFRGTLKYSTFLATLQFVDEIVSVAFLSSDSDIQKLTWSSFVSNISESKKELIDYLKRNRLYVNDYMEQEEEI